MKLTHQHKHLRIQIRKLSKRWLPVLLVVVLAAAIAVVYHELQAFQDAQDEALLSMLLDEEAEEETDLYADEETPMLFSGGKWYTLNEDLETVLILGIDKFDEDIVLDENIYTNHQQADFCLLLILDHARKTSTAIHLNRDTMTDVHTIGMDGKTGSTRYEQLALSHTYGTGGYDSCMNTVQTVSDFLYGVPIDSFICLTMDVVSEINNQVGGVRLTLMDDFTAEDPEMEAGAELTLTRTQALRYVRARQGMEDATNLRRMERQRQYLEALQEAGRTEMETSDDFLLRAVFAVADYLLSDCTADHLSQLATNVLEYDDCGIIPVSGEAKQGEVYVEFYADEAALKALVLDRFYTQTEVE